MSVLTSRTHRQFCIVMTEVLPGKYRVAKGRCHLKFILTRLKEIGFVWLQNHPLLLYKYVYILYETIVRISEL